MYVILLVVMLRALNHNNNILVVVRFIPVSDSALGLFLGQGVESVKRLKTYDPKIDYFR